MIQFDEKFFEGEERDGFYVESDMKRVWAAQMEVLMEVDRVCRKYGIKYFADSGTLLGAVRHNGFIPWDDDMDIAMLRSDYMKFVTVASKELEKPIRFLNIYEEEEWENPFGRVTNGRGITLEKDYLDRFHGCPYHAGIDVFVLDNIPLTEGEYNTVIDLYAWIWNVKNKFAERAREKLEQKGKEKTEGKKADLTAGPEDGAESDMKQSNPEEGCLVSHSGQEDPEGEGVVSDQRKDEVLENTLKEVEEVCCVKIDREKNIVNQLLKVIDGLFAMYGDGETDKVGNMSFDYEVPFVNAGRKREWYRDSMLLPFENIMIPVPIDFYAVVRRVYGNDFLTPVKHWHFHDYPYFKDLRKILRDWQKDVQGVTGRMGRLEEKLREMEAENSAD